MIFKHCTCISAQLYKFTNINEQYTPLFISILKRYWFLYYNYCFKNNNAVQIKPVFDRNIGQPHVRGRENQMVCSIEMLWFPLEKRIRPVLDIDVIHHKHILYLIYILFISYLIYISYYILFISKNKGQIFIIF